MFIFCAVAAPFITAEQVSDGGQAGTAGQGQAQSQGNKQSWAEKRLGVYHGAEKSHTCVETIV
jgi:hypothetical protein